MKISDAIAALQAIEKEHGPDLPVVQLTYGGIGRPWWNYERLEKVAVEPLTRQYCRGLHGLEAGQPCVVID